jgi:hypothetical protein
MDLFSKTERQGSLRPTLDTEQRVAGALLDAPAGFLWFTVVRKVAPVVRMRLFTLNFDNAETDLDEDTARELFESLDTPVLRDAEARLRKVMEGRS